MHVCYTVCCGLDVHKKSVAACLRTPGPDGQRVAQVRTFATTTRALIELADWLVVAGCTHVAMESTGIYWRPVYQILEERMTVLLVNAAHVSKVPGRKTDVKDCEWLAELLEHGLLRGSFVPPAPIRELRELTRSRRQLVEIHSQTANRVQKVLETANIKLGDVATDVLGASGRAMLKALIAGERDPVMLAGLALGRLKDKRAALEQVLNGRFTDHHAFLLRSLLAHLEFLEAQIGDFDRRIAEATRSMTPALEHLDTIPGVARRSAEQIIAELGDDMTQFPTAGNAASWTGICPGNHQSAANAGTREPRRAIGGYARRLSSALGERSGKGIATWLRNTDASPSDVATRRPSSQSLTPFCSRRGTFSGTAWTIANWAVSISTASSATIWCAITNDGLPNSV
jgi:transposase